MRTQSATMITRTYYRAYHDFRYYRAYHDFRGPTIDHSPTSTPARRDLYFPALTLTLTLTDWRGVRAHSEDMASSAGLQVLQFRPLALTQALAQ